MYPLFQPQSFHFTDLFDTRYVIGRQNTPVPPKPYVFEDGSETPTVDILLQKYSEYGGHDTVDYVLRTSPFEHKIRPLIIDALGLRKQECLDSNLIQKYYQSTAATPGKNYREECKNFYYIYPSGDEFGTPSLREDAMKIEAVFFYE